MSSSIIKSDNGVTSGVTGIVQTAGSDGTLLLQTTSAGGTATTALTIDTNQNATFAGKVIAGTGGNVMASWTTSGRPSSPVTGQMGYNTTYGGVEVYNGSAWTAITGGPAFSAYNGSNQTISTGTFTKLIFPTKEFDTNSNYDNSTNYRFTPTVAGYYQITGSYNGFSGSYESFITIYKNGSEFKRGFDNPLTTYLRQVTALVQLNGSTDYVEIYGYQSSGGSTNTNGGSTYTYFQAAMVRSA